MSKNLLFIFSILCALSSTAQNFTGQWKGSFTDRSVSFISWGGDQCEYILELESNNGKITGHSYTYFSDGGQRYYTICKLVGAYNKVKKTLEVKEISREKTNVPDNISNCFQVHTLKYSSDGTNEQLSGNWAPAPNQKGDCGYGFTTLLRRKLIKSVPRYNSVNRVAKLGKQKTNTVAKNDAPKKNNIIKKPDVAKVEKAKVVEKAKIEETKMALQPNNTSVAVVSNKAPETEVQIPSIQVPSGLNFEKRSNIVLNTIKVQSKTITVSFYDNAEVDGDSISIFYNGKLIAANQRLTTNAITFTLPVKDDGSINELVMYADNLGLYPPNTALMIVMDGNKRYEQRISSDLKKSGTIRFVHQE